MNTCELRSTYQTNTVRITKRKSFIHIYTRSQISLSECRLALRCCVLWQFADCVLCIWSYSHLCTFRTAFAVLFAACFGIICQFFYWFVWKVDFQLDLRRTLAAYAVQLDPVALFPQRSKFWFILNSLHFCISEFRWYYHIQLTLWSQKFGVNFGLRKSLITSSLDWNSIQISISFLLSLLFPFTFLLTVYVWPSQKGYSSLFFGLRYLPSYGEERVHI